MLAPRTTPSTPKSAGSPFRSVSREAFRLQATTDTATEDLTAAEMRRIDAGHRPALTPPPRSPGDSGTTDAGTTSTGQVTDPLLRLHTADLIAKLQAWGAELDAREARLNVRAAQQDLRERQFRFVRQSWLGELAEQRRSIERLQSEVQRQSHLAFEWGLKT